MDKIEPRQCPDCMGAGDDGHGNGCYHCDSQGAVVPFYHTTPAQHDAGAVAKLKAVADASLALQTDMLMRAKMNAHLNDGDVVVEAGNGVWFRFCNALAALSKGPNNE